MSVTNEQSAALMKHEWYDLGFPYTEDRVFIKRISDINGTRTQANIKACLNPQTLKIHFEPCYKKTYTPSDVEGMIAGAFEFMRLVRELRIRGEA